MTDPGFARVNIVVEGHTEEEFVGTYLAEHLAAFNVFVAARRVQTSRQGARVFRGGMTSYARTQRDVLTWLRQDGGAHVTTFFDLYALPDDFPGHAESRRHVSGDARASTIEQAFAADINHRNFIPFIQPHEFEALLFTDVCAIDQELRLTSPSRLPQLRQEIAGTAPEDLNDHPLTAPSKRLLRLFPGYDKPLHGPAIAMSIGLPAIRAACPHFNAWLTRLEHLRPA